MNDIEAMIYCLGVVSDVSEEGEYRSRSVYDRNGEPHWFAWTAWVGTVMCSESPTPFAKSLAPYSVTGCRQ